MKITIQTLKNAKHALEVAEADTVRRAKRTADRHSGGRHRD